MPCCRFTASFLDCSRCKCDSNPVYMAAWNIKGIHNVDSLEDLQGSALQKASDTALGIALCLHSHIHINSVLSDYVPKSVLGMFCSFHFPFTHVPDCIPTSNHVPSGCRCNTVWSIRCHRHCHLGADKVESGWTRSHPNSQKTVDCAASSVATAQSVCNVSTECGVRVTQGCYVGVGCFTQSGGNAA